MCLLLRGVVCVTLGQGASVGENAADGLFSAMRRANHGFLSGTVRLLFVIYWHIVCHDSNSPNELQRRIGILFYLFFNNFRS